MTPDQLDRLRIAARSILTAQSIAHRSLYEVGDDTHIGAPRECRRPLCARLLADVADIDQVIREVS